MKTRIAFTVVPACKAIFKESGFSTPVLKRTYTIASAIHAGLVKVSAAGTVTATKGGDAELFADLMGTTKGVMYGYWSDEKRQWLKDGKPTAKGRGEMTDSLNRTKGAYAPLPLVNQMVAALAKGGKVSHDGRTFHFKHEYKLTS